MDELSPIKKNLTAMMEIAVVVKENGDFWLVHDQEFEETPDWVEYDESSRSLILITDHGNMHEVGLELQPRAYERLKNAKTVFLIYMEEGENLEQIKELPVIVRE